MFFLLRSKRWVINLRREDLMKYSTEQLYVQYTVCANHFEDSQFMNPAQKNRLIHNAVPTLIAQHNAPPKLTPKRPPPKQRCQPIPTPPPPTPPPVCNEILPSETETNQPKTANSK